MFSEKRARFELANPKDYDLNVAHLTTLLPLQQPDVGIEPTTSCSVGRRATIAPARLDKKKTLAGLEPAPPRGID